MDISLREWLFLVGLLVVAAILVHGYLHMRRYKQETTSEFSNITNADDCNGELPNGGARIRSEDERQEPTLDQNEHGLKNDSDQDDGPVPVLMDSVSLSSEQSESSQVSMDFNDPETNASDQEMSSSMNISEISAHSEDILMQGARTQESSRDLASESDSTQEGKSFSQSEALAMSPRRQELEKCRLTEDHLGPTENPEKVFVIHVAAKDEQRGFNCGTIVDVASACGLRHGKMDIFHRHQDDGGKGKVQFSMVSAVAPGCFDLDKVDEQVIPGVTFFMSLPGPVNNIQAFDYMYEMAKYIASKLGGEVLDEQHSAMTPQTAEHMRQEIFDFERKLRISKTAN